ncbi:MAG: winged helix-turn-helix transcriptional regulator [Arcanobacterium sp.]|nr:winged helix-turn-helix transcriptional regulator [Arcanobacterium sp.]
MDRNDLGTCDQILRLIIERGPITPGELAKIMVLTPAAVRRHITTLTEDGYIQVYELNANSRMMRGRPSRKYVATPQGQAQLSEAYSDLATQAMTFMREEMGESGLEEFVSRRTKMLEQRYGPILEAAGPNVTDKIKALAQALDRDGFMTTLRRGGPQGLALQLCQGHCPVQLVAQHFPGLCEAETLAFSNLLGVPIQRLATQANGGHVCTTSIPIGIPKKHIGVS